MRRLAAATLWLAAGSLLPAGSFWALLNVPESSVAALGLSALLALVTVIAAGLVAGAAASAVGGSPIIRAARSLIPYAAALMVVAALWWLTTGIDSWWRLRRGEIDAVFLRYLAATRTQWVHASVFWLTWGVRWVLGLAVVAALVSAGVVAGARGIRAGLRASVSPLTLTAVTAAILALRHGVWRLVYWRPRRLPLSAEPLFVSTKLLILYVVSAAIVALLLAAVARAVRPRTT